MRYALSPHVPNYNMYSIFKIYTYTCTMSDDIIPMFKLTFDQEAVRLYEITQLNPLVISNRRQIPSAVQRPFKIMEFKYDNTTYVIPDGLIVTENELLPSHETLLALSTKEGGAKKTNRRSNKTVADLRLMARRRGIVGRSTMNKAQLQRALNLKN